MGPRGAPRSPAPGGPAEAALPAAVMRLSSPSPRPWAEPPKAPASAKEPSRAVSLPHGPAVAGRWPGSAGRLPPPPPSPPTLGSELCEMRTIRPEGPRDARSRSCLASGLNCETRSRNRFRNWTGVATTSQGGGRSAQGASLLGPACLSSAASCPRSPPEDAARGLGLGVHPWV